MRDDPRGKSRWFEGSVNPDREHIRICVGDDWEPIALIAPVSEAEFAAEFLIDSAKDPSAEEARDMVRAELDFYLNEKDELRPWAYAVYHCGTTSNVYSSVHWEHHRPGADGPVT
jgi:hypothetical protein